MSYAQPTAATLKLRYPAFAAVADETIDYWLGESFVEVGDVWPEDVRAAAQMAWTAHRMIEVGTVGVTGVQGGTGVSSFKSGTFSASLTDEAANRTGFDATVYGREYVAMQRRWFGGPMLVGCVYPPVC